MPKFTFKYLTYEFPDDVNIIVSEVELTEPIEDRMSDGTWVVFCKDDKDGNYVGWRTVEDAEKYGYKIDTYTRKIMDFDFHKNGEIICAVDWENNGIHRVDDITYEGLI